MSMKRLFLFEQTLAAHVEFITSNSRLYNILHIHERSVVQSQDVLLAVVIAGLYLSKLPNLIEINLRK